jgi:hypothetical protein
MSSLLPPGETVRKAAAFVAETRKEEPSRSLESILDEAGMRFSLTPLDGEALHRLFSDCAGPDGAP